MEERGFWRWGVPRKLRDQARMLDESSIRILKFRRKIRGGVKRKILSSPMLSSKDPYSTLSIN